MSLHLKLATDRDMTKLFESEFQWLTRICAAEMAVRYAALSACRKVHT